MNRMQGESMLDEAEADERRAARLILVSNRGPVEHQIDASGRVVRRANAGGVATALSSLAADTPITWIANGTSQSDCAFARDGRAVDLDSRRRLRFVAPSPESYDLYYATFCNPLLWFVQHGLSDRLQRFDSRDVVIDAWERGYLAVNQTFAEAVVAEIDREGGESQVMLHDYHLYAAPLFIRNLRPNAVLQHFVHIPWPAPRAWDILPRPIVQSICEGLLANDSVVFQTAEFAKNFLLTCEAALPDARIDADGGGIANAGRHTRVWHNPVSVDIWDLRGRLFSDEAAPYREQFAAEDGLPTIVRVDRVDPSKNITMGFRAYGRMLDTHSEWRGKARFLAFLVPSRTAVPEYQQYEAEVFAEIDEVNRRHGTGSWTPIEVFHEHNRPQALAALSRYDVLLVNSVVDGMNLVSKEGPALNDNDGVLVLSKTAGSYAELRDGALAVDAHDVDGTAEAMHRGLTMPAVERSNRARSLRSAILRHDLRRWLRLLIEDLDGAAVGPRSASARAASSFRR